MLKDKDFFNSFRTDNRNNAVLLTVTIVDNFNDEDVQTELIDAYEGEVGVVYTEKLLFRMANHILCGTVYESLPWEEVKDRDLRNGTAFAYMKKFEEEKYVLATAKYMKQ